MLLGGFGPWNRDEKVIQKFESAKGLSAVYKPEGDRKIVESCALAHSQQIVNGINHKLLYVVSYDNHDADYVLVEFYESFGGLDKGEIEDVRVKKVGEQPALCGGFSPFSLPKDADTNLLTQLKANTGDSAEVLCVRSRASTGTLEQEFVVCDKDTCQLKAYMVSGRGVNNTEVPTMFLPSVNAE